MKTFSVTVALIITGNHRRVFSVRSANIIDAQRRVLSRIKSIMKTTMFEVVSAAEQCVQADVCKCVAKSLEPYREPLFCDRCGKSKRR